MYLVNYSRFCWKSMWETSNSSITIPFSAILINRLFMQHITFYRFCWNLIWANPMNLHIFIQWMPLIILFTMYGIHFQPCYVQYFCFVILVISYLILKFVTFEDCFYLRANKYVAFLGNLLPPKHGIRIFWRWKQ